MKLRRVKQIIEIEEITEEGRPALKLCWRIKRFRSNETVIIPPSEYILLKTYFLEPYKTLYGSLSEQVEELKTFYDEGSTTKTEGVKHE